jgi:hypothetical protein
MIIYDDQIRLRRADDGEVNHAFVPVRNVVLVHHHVQQSMVSHIGNGQLLRPPQSVKIAGSDYVRKAAS